MDLETIRKELNDPDNLEVMDYLHKDVLQGLLVMCMMHMITNSQWADLKKRIQRKVW